MMKSFFVMLIALFLCCSNVVGQDFKIGIAASKDTLISLICKDKLGQEFNDMASKLEFQLEVANTYFRNMQRILLYPFCENIYSYNQRSNHISYLQKQCLKQHDEIAKKLEEYESHLIFTLDNIIDSVAKEVAVTNGLNAILEKGQMSFYTSDLTDCTAQIVSKSLLITKQLDLEELIDFNTFIEKLEDDWKVVMSKDKDDFSTTLED